ncbi:MAG: N-acetylglucosamine-6-phosphate deacetylase [Chloroflexi bacterium]|nr:N-acetylglucosamine-6-phosphate deacetylase [Chloroflexota bacterium]
MTKSAIKTQRLFTPLQELRDAIILIDGEQIEAVGLQENIPVPDGYEVRDVADRIVAPGLIDIHVHGGNGHFAREGAKAVQEVSKWLVTTGTTSWLATVGDLEGIKGVVKAIKQGIKGAAVEGIHGEGPFIYPKYLPGEPQDPPPPAEISTYHELLEASEGHMVMMDCSPDLPGGLGLIREIHRSGVVASFAHGEAGYELFMRAVEAGVRHVTHTYNVMVGMHHRRPGAVGAALTCDSLMCELNADGFHVHPAAMDVLIRCKGLGNVCLISDMQAAAGLPDGEYDWSDRVIDGEFQWVGVKLIKKDGMVRLAHLDGEIDGTISSSVWPIRYGVRNIARDVGLPLKDAVRLASLNPAVAAGIDKHVGSLEPGKRADLIVMDQDVNIYLAMVAGKVMYEA